MFLGVLPSYLNKPVSKALEDSVTDILVDTADPETRVKFYDSWSEKYEEDLVVIGHYTGRHNIIIPSSIGHYTDRYYIIIPQVLIITQVGIISLYPQVLVITQVGIISLYPQVLVITQVGIISLYPQEFGVKY